ncbi:hypothetical protein [Longimicrobium sp.]|uniref:hypothetical protein n=1 Tax=Longimicrobium sp. TaxID=2029185 RepID=UPI003B3B17B5
MMKTRFLVLLPLVAILASGCMHWHAAPVPPPRPQGDSLVLGTARLILRPAPGDSAAQPGHLVLRDIQVHGDSVVGLGKARLSARRRIAVHRDEVIGVEFRRPNGWGTVGVVVLSAVGAVVAIIVVTLATYGPPRP